MRFRRRRSRLTIPRHDVINACSGMKRKAARIAQASRPSAHSLLSYSLVPHDTTVSGSAAGGRVKVAEWTSTEGADGSVHLCFQKDSRPERVKLTFVNPFFPHHPGKALTGILAFRG